MANLESVPDLIRHLCGLHLHHEDLGLAERLAINQSSERRKLKRKAFDALFGYLKKNESRCNASKNTLAFGLEEELSVYCFDLRHHCCFDDALKLEQITEALSDHGKIGENLRSTVKFLLCLKDTAESSHPSPIGHGSEYQHDANTRQAASVASSHLGDVRIYGATRLDLPMTNSYMYYPSNVFARPGSDTIHLGSRNYPVMNNQIFSMEPEVSLKDTKVSDQGDSFLHKTTASLFGALVKSGKGSLDTRLELPDLPSTVDQTALDLKFPRIMEFAEDEGFVDSLMSPGYSSLQSPVSSMKTSSVDIWSDALNHKVNRCHRWEMIGCFTKNSERPFVSEAGSEAFDRLYCYHQYQLQMVDSSLHISPVHVVDSKQLMRDLQNVLVAVPSQSFHFDRHQGHFSVMEGLCMSGISPMALRNLCGAAVQCGSDFLWLSQFAEPRQPNCDEPFSLVLESFRSAVRNYLQHFVAHVLSIPLLATVLEFLNVVRKPVHQMNYLTKLCMKVCDNEENKNLPMGGNLLSQLYNECLVMDGSEHRLLLLSLLQTTAKPYLKFIHDWVFHGICRDDYSEFMLQVDDDQLQTRDCRYWNKAFTLIDPDPLRTVPAFLTDVVNDIFLCGKSLNLLKLCKPMHFLFVEEQNNLPELCLTFSTSELLQHERNSQIYFGRMQAVALQVSRSKQDLKTQADKAKHELMAEAHKAAADELKRLHEGIIESRRQDNLKKQTFFAQLKDQMEQKTKRIEEERGKEKAEDKARVESTTKQELLEAAVDVEFEKQIRQELIQYYSKLSEDAVLREQRALWKVRRHKLDQKRLEFLKADELKLQEMQKATLTTPEVTECDAVAKHVHPSSFDSDSQSISPVPEQKLPSISSIDEASEITHSAPGTIFEVLPFPPVVKSTKLEAVAEINNLDKDVDEVSCLTLEKENVLTVKSGDEVLSEKSELDLVKNDSADVESDTVAKHTLTVEESRNSSDKILDQGLFGAMSDNQGTDVTLKTHLKMCSNVNSTSETVQSKEKHFTKSVPGKFSTLESEEHHDEGRQHLKMNPKMNATKTSEETSLKIKRQNVYGHISQISYLEFDVTAPRLKKIGNVHAVKESDWDDFTSFQIRPHRRKGVAGQSVDKQTGDDSNLKPHIRMNSVVNALTESEFVDVDRLSRKAVAGQSIDKQTGDDGKEKPHIKMNSVVNALTESEFVDVDRLKTERFRSRNVHGHSSNSSVQHLLYGDKFSEAATLQKVEEKLADKGDGNGRLQKYWADGETEQYSLDYGNLDDFSVVDLMPSILSKNSSSLSKKQAELLDFVSLPLLIKRSLMSALNTQIPLVNQSMVNYFMMDLEIENHFVALQRFLLLQDGEFSQSLCDQLFSKIASSEKAADVLNPMFLNSVLHKAIASSLFGETKFSDAVSFAHRPIPQKVQHCDLNVLDYLVITYKVEWPLNIVITDDCLMKYAKIFNFMVKLRHTIWLLNAIFHRLKRDARVHGAGSSAEMKMLQLYRHEMQHFAKVIEEYIASQVIHVSWHEFQQDLGLKMNNLDDLIRCHVAYLNKCVARCLLNTNMAAVMKIMQDTFSLILKFNNQLVSQSWQKETLPSDRIYHPAFNSLQESYRAFHNQSSFLFKVVRNIAECHYQPHFQDLLVRLGFNDFYRLNQYAVRT